MMKTTKDERAQKGPLLGGDGVGEPQKPIDFLLGKFQFDSFSSHPLSLLFPSRLSFDSTIQFDHSLQVLFPY